MHIDKWECCYSQRDTRFCIGVWKKRLQTRFFDSMMDGALATSTPFANNTNKMQPFTTAPDFQLNDSK